MDERVSTLHYALMQYFQAHNFTYLEGIKALEATIEILKSHQLTIH